MANTVNIPLIDIKGKESGSFSAPEALFGAEPNEAVVHFVCEGQRFRFYKRTATTKGRAMVRGTGKKSRKQKGNGASRQGDAQAPHWVGGGVAFGPTGIKRHYKVNKKVRDIALASVLSDRQSSGQIKVLKGGLDKPQTKSMVDLLAKLAINTARVGFVLGADEDAQLAKSVRNIRNVDTLTEEKWTPYDFIKTDALIFSEKAMERLVSRFGKGAKA